MSMIMTLKQAPQDTLDLLVQRPELAIVFWMDPDYKPAPTPGWVKWLAKLLGGYSPPMDLPEAPPELTRTGSELSLEKSWHGIQWLLTRPQHQQPGDEWDIEPPEGALLNGGTPIEGSDHGFGNDRALSATETVAFDELLQGAPWETLVDRFDGELMNESEIYPSRWTEPSEHEDLAAAYTSLRDFVHSTHQLDRGLVVALS